jgi:hypothetical protein
MDSRSDAVASAIDSYFNLMYDAADDRFPNVFHDACLIHGMREESLRRGQPQTSVTSCAAGLRRRP